MIDEEMAEEWVKENMDCVKTVSYLNHDCNYFSDEERSIAKSAFKDGYNKANEWHYVKDGEYPSKHLESYVVAFYGAKGSVAKGKPCWEELCWDAEFLRWVERETFEDLPYVNTEGIVIAWKEIVLPKEIENA